MLEYILLLSFHWLNLLGPVSNCSKFQYPLHYVFSSNYIHRTQFLNVLLIVHRACWSTVWVLALVCITWPWKVPYNVIIVRYGVCTEDCFRMLDCGRLGSGSAYLWSEYERNPRVLPGTINTAHTSAAHSPLIGTVVWFLVVDYSTGTGNGIRRRSCCFWFAPQNFSAISHWTYWLNK